MVDNHDGPIGPVTRGTPMTATASTTMTDLQIPVGAPCWMDLVSSDPDVSVTF